MDTEAPEVARKIKNSHLLTDIFGRWPSFHDAQVFMITLDRDGTGSNFGPTLRTSIRVFEMTSQVEDGKYVLKNQVIAHLSFFEVVQMRLVDFNYQNVLSSLYITDLSDRQLERVRFQVTFDGIFGVEATFQCYAISVESVEPLAREQVSES